MTTKYSPSVSRRPSASAIRGRTMHPRIVPVDSSIVAYDASRAASAGAYPWRIAICVTDVGTYTVPAHRPTIDTSRNAEFSSVRRA